MVHDTLNFNKMLNSTYSETAFAVYGRSSEPIPIKNRTNKQKSSQLKQLQLFVNEFKPGKVECAKRVSS